MKFNKKQNTTTDSSEPTTSLFNTELFKNHPDYIERLENKTTEKMIKATNLSRGDTITIKDQICTVVEVIDTNRWHVKNTQEPFNSFIITAADLEVN